MVSIKITEINKIGKHEFPHLCLYHFEPIKESTFIKMTKMEEGLTRFTQAINPEVAQKIWTRLLNNGGEWINKKDYKPEGGE